MKDWALASKLTDSGFSGHLDAPKAMYFSAVRSSIRVE
jgi:hypothetical protein